MMIVCHLNQEKPMIFDPTNNLLNIRRNYEFEALFLALASEFCKTSRRIVKNSFKHHGLSKKTVIGRHSVSSRSCLLFCLGFYSRQFESSFSIQNVTNRRKLQKGVTEGWIQSYLLSERLLYLTYRTKS